MINFTDIDRMKQKLDSHRPLPPPVLAVENRLAYYEALDTAHTQNNYAPFIAFVADAVKTGFDPYWHAMGISDNKT